MRREFERFLLAHRGITEAIRRLGSGARSRPRVILLHQTTLKELKSGKTAEEVSDDIALVPEFSFLSIEATNDLFEPNEGKFDRSVKGAAFLRDAIPSAPRCPTCGGFMHRNGMQAGHRVPRREGGTATVENAAMQHPFCNSTVEN